MAATGPLAEPAAPATRSTFVTVLAWIFIVLSGFSTLVAIAQNIMISVVFPTPETFPTVDPATGKAFPWIFQFMFRHFELFFLAFLAVSAITLVASIGLLWRKNWARVLFIAMMCLGIAWNVGGVLLMIPMFSFFDEMAGSATQAAVADTFGVAWKVMAGVNLLFVVGFVWLFGWIVKRLASGNVRSEFAAR